MVHVTDDYNYMNTINVTDDYNYMNTINVTDNHNYMNSINDTSIKHILFPYIFHMRNRFPCN